MILLVIYVGDCSKLTVLDNLGLSDRFPTETKLTRQRNSPCIARPAVLVKENLARLRVASLPLQPIATTG
jgi:hypothetical protein